MKKMRGYITSRNFRARAPQHVQNIVIRDYCEQQNYKYLLSVVEHIMPSCTMILEQAVSSLERYDGIVLYSMWQLPESLNKREYIFRQVLSKKKELHFALERVAMSSVDDIESLECMIQAAKVLEAL